MFAPSRYLEWTRRFHGRVRFDLATSGTPTVDTRELPAPPGGASEPADEWTRLREAIATYNEVPRSEVLPALGTTHALWLACASLLSPGDDVLIEEPGYEPLVRIAEGVGATVVRFAREARCGFALDAQRIDAAMTPKTRLVVVTNLHNPTGVRAGDDALRAVAGAAEAVSAHLLVDEVYAAFDTLLGDRGTFPGSARKLASNIVAVSSLTKCFGLGLERFGWLLGSAEVVRRARDALIANVAMLPRSHVQGGLAAFTQLPGLAVRSRRLLAGKRSRVAAWVAGRGLSWSAPADGLFGMVTLPERTDLTATIEAAAVERSVLVSPGAFFGAPNAFRIAWSLPADLLDDALEQLTLGLGL